MISNVHPKYMAVIVIEMVLIFMDKLQIQVATQNVKNYISFKPSLDNVKHVNKICL